MSSTVAGTIVTRTMSMTVAGTMAEVMVMVVMMPRMIPVVVVVPTPVVAVPIVGTIPVVVIVPRIVIAVVIRIVITVVVRVEAPVPSVAYIDVCGASTVATRVVVIVIIHGGAGSGAKTLDTGCKVLIIIGFGSGVNHAVGVCYRLSGLIHRLDVGLVVLAVRIIRLIVVGGIAADSGGGAAAVSSVLSARMVVWRVIGVVVSHLLVGGAANGDKTCHQYRNYSNCFHFVMYFDLISYFCNLKNASNYTNIIPRWQKN